MDHADASYPDLLKRSVLEPLGLQDTVITNTGNYRHNGGTGGFTSYAFFNPQGNNGRTSSISPKSSSAALYRMLLQPNLNQ